MTPEIQKSLEVMKSLLDQVPALVSVRNELIAYREKVAILLAEMDKAINALGGSTPPIVEPTPNLPTSPGPSPDIPPSLDTKPEKKSVWSKIGGVFKKVWPIASTVLLGTGGVGAVAAMAVNAITGATTVDPVTAGSSAAAAGLIGTITGAYKTTK